MPHTEVNESYTPKQYYVVQNYLVFIFEIEFYYTNLDEGWIKFDLRLKVLVSTHSKLAGASAAPTK